MASPQKRVAQAAVLTECKRARLSQQDVALKCGQLTEALLKNPIAAKTLVASLLEQSLAVEPDQRGALQEKLVAEIRDIVHTLHSWKAVTVSQVEDERASLQRELDACHDAQLVAEAQAQAARGCAVELGVTAANDLAAMDAANAAVKEQLVENRLEDRTFDQLVKDKEKLLQVFEFFVELRDTNCEKAKRAKMLKALMTVGAAHSFDSTMMEMLPSCLQTAVDQRSSFDALCLSTVESAMTSKLEELDKQMAEVGQGKERRAKDLEQLKGAAACATEAHRASQSKVDEAQAEESEAKSAGKKAEAKGKQARKALANVEKRLQEAQAVKQDFAASTVSDFELLRSREMAEADFATASPPEVAQSASNESVDELVADVQREPEAPKPSCEESAPEEPEDSSAASGASEPEMQPGDAIMSDAVHGKVAPVVVTDAVKMNLAGA